MKENLHEYRNQPLHKYWYTSHPVHDILSSLTCINVRAAQIYENFTFRIWPNINWLVKMGN